MHYTAHSHCRYDFRKMTEPYVGDIISERYKKDAAAQRQALLGGFQVLVLVVLVGGARRLPEARCNIMYIFGFTVCKRSNVLTAHRARWYRIEQYRACDTYTAGGARDLVRVRANLNLTRTLTLTLTGLQAALEVPSRVAYIEETMRSIEAGELTLSSRSLGQVHRACLPH